MQYFVLIYDRKRGEITDHRAFARVGDALDDARRTQLGLGFEANIEIVVLGGKSYEDLKKTHSRYFKTAQEIINAA